VARPPLPAAPRTPNLCYSDVHKGWSPELVAVFEKIARLLKLIRVAGRADTNRRDQY
jgi:hypothetical protein